jgi:hypothetical protein
MINEVQLIVKKGTSSNILNISDNPIFGGIGEQRIITNAFANEMSLDDTSMILYNAAGQSQNVFCNSIQQDTPSVGQTRFNFSTIFAFDFRVSRGGYFIFGNESEYYLDLYENESISQNWSFTDISEFATVGSYSREFRVPLSDRNQQVFGAVSDVNYLNDGTTDTLFNTKIPAEIRVNTLPIIKGHLRVMRAFKQLDRLTDVQLTFYSETPDLIRNIGDKKIADLTDISDLDHTCDYATVTDTTQEYLYSLIDRGQKWDETGTVGSRPVLNSSQPLFPADLTPSVKWRWIFEKIMSDAAFTYNADDLLVVLDNYYMPFITRTSLFDPTSYLFTAQITANQSITSGGFLTNTTELVDNDNVYASDTFTAPTDSVYYFVFWTTVFVSSPVFNTRIIEVYLTDTTTSTDYLAGSITNGNTGNQYISGYTPAFFTLIGGHTYRVKYRVYNGAMLEITVPQVFQYNAAPTQGTGWRLAQVGDVTNNLPIVMSEFAPDVKQVDFLRDIIRMHNLVIVPDRNRENHLIIQSMVNYLGSGNSLDWTSKLDVSKDITIESTTDIQRENLTFTYSLGGDVASKFFNDVGGRTYGDYKINGYQVNPSIPANQFATGDNTVKLTTQSTPAQEIRGTNIAIPKFINDKGEFVAPFMRCLYYADDAEIQLSDTVTSSLVAVPVLNHYSTVNATISDFDLNFAPETPLHDITTNPTNNLFNLYWRDYLNAIYSPDARLMTASLALDLSDILTFSFADVIWIKDAYWRILNIADYKVGGSDSTVLKLLKVINNSASCELSPNGALISGQILWVNGAGDAASGTQECCSLYGWFWSPSKNACFGNIIRSTNATTATEARSISVTQAPVNALKSAVNLDADISSQFSAYVGAQITIDKGNIGTLAVGRSLTLEGENGGAALLGKNVLAKSGGLHLGGGWMNNSSSSVDGCQQWGVLIHANKDLINASGDELEMPIESIANNRINMPDDTTWTCVINANVRTVSTFAHYMWSVHLIKDAAGIASSLPPVLIGSDTNMTQVIDLVIDTASDTSEHRISLEFTGASFPIQMYAMMTTQYLQLRV